MGFKFVFGKGGGGGGKGLSRAIICSLKGGGGGAQAAWLVLLQHVLDGLENQLIYRTRYFLSIKIMYQFFFFLQIDVIATMMTNLEIFFLFRICFFFLNKKSFLD